jgi:hypothetical protein
VYIKHLAAGRKESLQFPLKVNKNLGSEPQCLFGLYIIFTANMPKFMNEKMEYRGSPHCLPSNEGV